MYLNFIKLKISEVQGTSSIFEGMSMEPLI